MFMPRFARSMGCVVVAALFAACSNGRGSLAEQQAQTPPPTAPAQGSYSIGGSVTGLTGSGLVLQSSSGGTVAVTGDGPFTFTGTVASGTAYDVTVSTQPSSPAQTCTVTNGSGSVGSGNVTNVVVTCSAAPRFSVGGAVSGLTGPGLVLQNNAGDDLAVTADGSFVFAAPLENGSTYSVTVRTQPSAQNCVVQNASGTIANANVANIQVSCTTNFTVGGTVSGLQGTGLVIQLNGGNNFSAVSNGPFAFPVALSNGAAYSATVLAQPRNPSQECSVANGSGTIASANVANLAITCVTRTFTVGGSVSGLAGTGLTLRLNGTQDLAIMGNGNFTFPTPILSGTSYTVTFVGRPQNPLQTCTATNATGTVGNEAVTTVAVSCATETFAVSGSVSGLLGSGLRLRNSNGEAIPIAANGEFVFPTKVASGATYEVRVDNPPANPTQGCTITNGAGTVTIADIANVQVNCSTSSFAIGGTVSGLLGSGLILVNNGVDNLTVGTNGAFTFATTIPSGTGYAVTVAQQPTAPSQTCTVSNGSGTVQDRGITTVSVQCVTNGFLIGGQVTGLLGSGLQIQLNGGETLNIAASGPFRFSTALPAGTPYSVGIAVQPVQPVQGCLVTNGVGTTQGADVTNVAIHCDTIGGPL